MTGCEVLEIRRRPAREHYMYAAAWGGAVVVGVALVLSSAVALVVEPMDQQRRIQAVCLTALGAAMVALGLVKLRHVRQLLSRDVVIRLDDTGVHLRGGSVVNPVNTFLGWPHVVGIEVTPVELDPELMHSHGPTTMLRFLPDDDTNIAITGVDTFTAIKAAALGLTPTAASAALLQGTNSSYRVPLILDWVHAHQPQVAVRVAAQSPRAE